MTSLATWMIALTISLCAVIFTAAANAPVLHMVASGTISSVFALVAIADHRRLVESGASKSLIGSSTAHHASLVWIWGALGILVTYGLILDQRWPEWWHFFIGFLLAAAASMVFSIMLARDAEAGKVDPSVMKLGRGLIVLQLVGMIGALISLFVDGKFPRDVSHPDWAGCNIFFFGALSIAAISANALMDKSGSEKVQ